MYRYFPLYKQTLRGWGDGSVAKVLTSKHRYLSSGLQYPQTSQAWWWHIPVASVLEWGQEAVRTWSLLAASSLTL